MKHGKYERYCLDKNGKRVYAGDTIEFCDPYHGMMVGEVWTISNMNSLKLNWPLIRGDARVKDLSTVRKVKSGSTKA